MSIKGFSESLEARRLLALAIDPIAISAIDEGDAASYTIEIRQPLPSRHQYRIEWGDGDEYTSGVFDDSVTSFTAPAHTFRDNGPSPSDEFHGVVTVVSLDPNGAEIEQAQRAFTQVVHNLAPAVGSSPLIGRTTVEGQGLTFEYTQIDRGEDDAITVTTDWGDGDVTIHPAVRVTRPAAGFNALPTKPKPYAYVGTYPITVTSVDDDGGMLVEQAQVIVKRQFALLGDTSVISESQYSLELRTTNPQSDEVNWLIDWGDGSSTEQLNLTMSATAPAFATHTYSGPISIAPQIVATPSDDKFTYEIVSKSIDVLGTLPAVPTLFGVEVSANTATDLPYPALRQVKISWNSVVPQRLDSFDIERSSDGILDWQTIASELSPDPVGTTSLTDLAATHTYFYRVSSRYNGERSSPSPVMAARMEIDYGFELSAQVSEKPAQITLSWTPADAATAGFRVYRKGTTDFNWVFFDEVPATQNSYIDTNVGVGWQYEYRVDRLNVPRATASPDDVDRAFIMSGIKLPLPNLDERRGVILVIDSTANDDPAVASGIEQLKRDLIGERYEVATLFVQPSDDPFAAHAIRNQLETLTQGISAPVAAIMLIGHVPAPFSGHGAYDFHSDHLGAWSTDAFYGDLVATRHGQWWTDNDEAKANRVANDNRPRDGKFDNDVVPDRIEAPVGRVDFFEPGGSRAVEFAALASYLAKDHRYRTGQTVVTKDAVIDVRLGRGHSVRATPQYTMFEGLVGRDAVATRNWRAVFQEPQIHQFAAAIAAGSWDRIFDPNQSDSSDGNIVYPFEPYDINALFLQTTGSLFGDFYSYDTDLNSPNMLRYLLRSGEALTNIYVESAPLEMHSFGSGETIGQSLLRTINSKGEYDRSASSIHGSITLNLMGDPTLTMNIVQPVSSATATIGAGVVQVAWTGTPAAIYRVYRASSINSDFEFIGETDKTAFTDNSPGANHLYMVRAIELQQSRSGSYFAGSTGAIVDAVTRFVPVKNLPPVNAPIKPGPTQSVMKDLEDWIRGTSS
ncbi:MAG: fibronectin type III domain-containing protein [Anaerolineae bacterium]|nr:fibronectin type III domain-containing protein [Phycisphaerae bacterium]